MKILYVAPRFHTNQIPIMKGFLDAGDEVCFVSQYQGGTEDYEVIKPVILGYSALFSAILWAVKGVKKLVGKYRENDYNFQAKFGFLPKKKFIRVLDSLCPDAVILRDRSVYNIAITNLCGKRKIPCILYTQSPYYLEENPSKNPIKNYFRSHTPGVRITPVRGNDRDGRIVPSPNTYYVPFVIEPIVSYEERNYLEGETVHILGVGKYEPRKNHEMLLRIAKECEDTKLHVTIVGEDVTTGEHEYLAKLQRYVKEHGLDERVTLKRNLKREEVFAEYAKADIFALPSTGEFASVSQLEAMAHSVAVICSDTNGTACNVEDGANGYLFKDGNYEDFKAKIELFLADLKQVEMMGKRSYCLVKEKYCFAEYKSQIVAILKDMEGQDS